ncbi:unnamed protein product [Moneuplotes crassus]|uniref:Uncharacterized protein n=1 Tax=Euplotes crassus TaxID=5936 RepID=A0AAD1XH51_EUPCR|nr:unnamed protein product [Moneuplotes crassus]
MKSIQSSSVAKNEICKESQKMSQEKVEKHLEECDFIEEEPSALCAKKKLHASGFNHSVKNVLVCNKGKPLTSEKKLVNKNYKEKIDKLFCEDIQDIDLSSVSLNSDGSVSCEGEYAIFISPNKRSTFKKQSSLKKDCFPSFLKLHKKSSMRTNMKNITESVRSNDVSSPELMKRLLC